jgi:type I restriction enzyme, S subunit
VPQGWERVKISDMGEVVTGKTPSTKMADYYGREIPFIKTPDMHKASVVVTTEQYLSRSGADSQKNKYIPPGSIMVSCIGTVGVVAMNASIAQTNQQINSLVPTMPNIQFYAYFALSDLRPFLEGMGGGATMANVSKSKFESIEVVLPGIETLQKFDHYCRPIFLQIEKLTIQSLKLAAARDLLLPRLMNGEIAV